MQKIGGNGIGAAVDLVRMKVVDVMAFGQIKERTSVLQSKTQQSGNPSMAFRFHVVTWVG
jgi:hypothetical protein